MPHQRSPFPAPPARQIQRQSRSCRQVRWPNIPSHTTSPLSLGRRRLSLAWLRSRGTTLPRKEVAYRRKGKPSNKPDRHDDRADGRRPNRGRQHAGCKSHLCGHGVQHNPPESVPRGCHVAASGAWLAGRYVRTESCGGLVYGLVMNEFCYCVQNRAAPGVRVHDHARPNIRSVIVALPKR